jgi:hypothetical protein
MVSEPTDDFSPLAQSLRNAVPPTNSAVPEKIASGRAGLLKIGKSRRPILFSRQAVVSVSLGMINLAFRRKLNHAGEGGPFRARCKAKPVWPDRVRGECRAK